MEWLLVAAGLITAYFVGKSTGGSNSSNERGVGTSVAPKPKTTVHTPKPKEVSQTLNVRHVEVGDINLSDEQSRIFNLIEKTNDCYYITGKAGTGKSVLLQYFEKHTGKRTVVVAPTGVAALNVSGQTIHSFFKMPFEIDLKDLKVDYKTREILRNIDTVIIDEISMVRVDLMEAISLKLQIAKENKEPFGGVQMVI